jgi:hypothetical protein
MGVVLASCGVVMSPRALAMPAQPVEREVETREKIVTIHEYEQVIREVEKERGRRLNAAIFIKNRAPKVDDQKTRVLEDMLIGDVTDAGISVVSPEDTVTAVRRFLRTEEQRERTTIDDRAKTDDENRLMSQAADRMLEDSASALRLAQMMGVDYLLVASITSYGQETQRINRPDLHIDRSKTTHRLRASYKVLDGVLGGSETAGNISAEKDIATDHNGGAANASDLILDDLLADASVQMGGALGRKIAEGRVREVQVAAARLPFQVMCSMQDMSVPEIVRDDNGKYVVTGNNYRLEPMSVTVELDGVVVGSTPGMFEALPGLHRIRLTREGFEPWERHINLAKRSDDQPMLLQVALQLDDKGFDRWLRMMDELNALKQGQALTDAQVEVAQGLAEFFKKSSVQISGPLPSAGDKISIWNTIFRR